MENYEVGEPILNSPYGEPKEHWYIQTGRPAEKREGRRPAGYYYRDPRAEIGKTEHEALGQWVELEQVNLIRQRLADWRRGEVWPGVTRTTLELLRYWRREGREHRLFFAQLEAAETIIFLNEARRDYLQGIEVPLDEPTDDRKSSGSTAFRRYACKMATGTGKTWVMGMVAAWSILNKVHSKGDSRFSDVVLVICPNLTIRSRLAELNPLLGEASLYRTRDIVPNHMMPDLAKGRVLVTNWHTLEPQGVQAAGTSAKVSKAGLAVRRRERVHIGAKTTTARGKRYLKLEDFKKQVTIGSLRVIEPHRDRQGLLKFADVESTEYVESDTALVNRVLRKEFGGKQNVLVLNDEAHHAYRILRPESENGDEEEGAEDFYKSATVWIDGLDRIHKLRKINFCVDLSATPYFLGRVGQDTNRVFPWVVSDFGLTDAIESGLVKIPQLAVRDPSGNEIPGYFNIWHWILRKLTARERGGKRASPKPEAILKYAHHPIAMLAGLWGELRDEWESVEDDPRGPVFILVCKNTSIAKVIYEWLANGDCPPGIPAAGIEGLRNRNGHINTIRVDSKVVNETDTEGTKDDEKRWMRFTLDTVGKIDWPRDRQQRALCPEGFEELAKKLGRPVHPPGRDVRCIVSVGMLTEGWDCNTVTHILGLRPFMSQLLCEQVVGRGLRRKSYEIGEREKLTEEVAKIFGVPFEVIPFKQSAGAGPKTTQKRNHVYAVPQKAEFEIRFPRVEGYRQAIRNRVSADWTKAPTLFLNPQLIPPQVQMKAALPSNQGRPTLTGPGRLVTVDLNPYRKGIRLQQLVFEMAGDLTRQYVNQRSCRAPAHVLFPQLAAIVGRYLREYVRPLHPAELVDAFLSPYYGWIIEILAQLIVPDTAAGEEPELPAIEANRPPGSTADVDLFTSRHVREVVRSHLNCVVCDTKIWEESAAYFIDTHDGVTAFVKNASLGFTIPYFHNGQDHDYVPDFLIRLKTDPPLTLILETKGYDPLAEVKTAAAMRWVDAVNAHGGFGKWCYAVAKGPGEVVARIEEALATP